MLTKRHGVLVKALSCVHSLSSNLKHFHWKEAPVHRHVSASRGLWAQPLLRERVLTRVKMAMKGRTDPQICLFGILL